MSNKEISLQAHVPLDGFTQLKELLSSIKNSLIRLIEPLKVIGDYVQSISESASNIQIKPKIDTSELDTASTVLDGIAAVLGVVAVITANIPEPTFVTKVVAVISAVVSALCVLISYLLQLDWDAVGEGLVDLWNSIVSGLSAAWNTISEIFINAVTWINDTVIVPIGEFFTGLWDGIVSVFSSIAQWFSELFGSIWQTVSDVFYNIGVIAGGCWEIIKRVWGVVASWFDETIIQPVAGLFSGLWEGFKEKAIAAWEGVKSIFVQLPIFLEPYSKTHGKRSRKCFLSPGKFSPT